MPTDAYTDASVPTVPSSPLLVATNDTPIVRRPSEALSRHNVHSTIRMNPYVRCVRGGGEAVPEVRSLSELLAAPITTAPAEMDTPCLRPTSVPSPVARSFAVGGGGSLSPHRRSAQLCASGHSADQPCPPRRHFSPEEAERRRAGLTDSPGAAHPSRGPLATAASPPLQFTHEGVATPNSFASVRKLERWLRQQQQEAQRAKHGTPHLALTQSGSHSHPDRPEPAMMDAISMRLPASTNDMYGDDGDDELNKESSVNSALVPTDDDLLDQVHLPRTDVEENLPNNRIVSPRSSSRVQSPNPPPLTDDQQAADAVGRGDGTHIATPPATTGAAARRDPHHEKHRKSSARAFPSAPHPLRFAPSGHAMTAHTMEGSPYHYLMRNYVGGTFLYYAHPESKQYFLDLCYRIVDQVRPILEQETLFPQCGLFPRLGAPAFVLGDIHGNFEDLSFFLQRLLVFHDFNLTPSNLLCLGDYVDRGPFSLECVMLLLSLKIMNASKIVMLRGNHEDRVVCGDLQTYGRGCFLAQCHAVFGYEEGMKLFRAVTGLFRYLPLAAELVIPSAPNAAYLHARSQFASFNVYGSETTRVVPIHGTPAVLSPMQPPTVQASATSMAGGGGGASGVSSSSATSTALRFPGGLEATAIGAEQSLPNSPRCACTPLPAREGQEKNVYSTILVANTSLGQPTREEAHEERILCTHGGIPRFFCPPREDGALDFLRSLRFPRLLTLFPNNPLAMADAECAPEYYFDVLLPRLVRSYPQLAHMALVEMEAHTAATTTSSEETASQAAADVTVDAQPTSSSGDAPATECTHAGTERDAYAAPRSALEARLAKLVSYSHDDLRRAWFITFDLLWSDPTATDPDTSATPGSSGLVDASSSATTTRVNEWGFGINTRGSHVVSFSARAVERFLSDYNYAMLFRAHQEKTHGLRWCKSNKVLTLFSSSNYLGHGNGAGCVVLSVNGEVQMIEKVGNTLPY